MGNMKGKTNSSKNGLNRYLSVMSVWALAFGCSVGWGSFVMPGTTFLPIAGPGGTVLGMIVGGLVMLVIGVNYYFLMNRFPDCGGTFAFTKRVFGYDHGFLSTWFIILVYIAIVWANATALPIIGRNLFGSLFQVGFHYNVAGFDVYFGECLLSVTALTIAAGVCIVGGRYCAWVQSVMACVLIGGVVLLAVLIFSKTGISTHEISPLFVEGGQSSAVQILQIVVLAPWAFAGFESVAHSVEEFGFPVKKIMGILFAAVITATVAYSLLGLIAVANRPVEYDNWVAYISDLGNLSGFSGLPTLYSAFSVLGTKGLLLFGFAAGCAIMTGLVGNMVAGSRLLYALARDNMLPSKLSVLSNRRVPVNALVFLWAISIPVAFFGRTAIGWIVDVNTIGATIAYAYTSAVAYKEASDEGKTLYRLTGGIGFLVSLAFTLYFLIPNIWSASTLSSESYLILIFWSIFGFIFFWYVFHRDRERRFGQSTVVWIVLLFLIFFVTMLWFREETKKTTAEVLNNLNFYNEQELREHGIVMTETEYEDAGYYLEQQVDIVNDAMENNSMMQMATILLALLIMFSIYNFMKRRENDLEIEKVKAEENSKAKSVFLSNMSHDIRTPMNAIVGYTQLAKEVENLPGEEREYLEKIESSSHHLLTLINDVLDMSRIESGKVELEVSKADLFKVFGDVRDIFATQMEAKNISYIVDTSGIRDRFVMCDANRLSRILLNLISNAYKFTPEGGSVTVSMGESRSDGKTGEYVLRVKDTGMGMSKEFASKVFEAYERERTANNIQGTGLGMAITKNFVEMMDGSIEVVTEKGVGSEFIVYLSFDIAEETEKDKKAAVSKADIDYSKLKLLLVEDQVVNRELATRILKKFGFQLDFAENGQVAVDKIAASSPGEFDAILMDIQMPVMNGYDAAKAIRALEDETLSSIPIIAMTANAFAEDVQAAKDAGMNSHIAKPIDINAMIAELNKVLVK